MIECSNVEQARSYKKIMNRVFEVTPCLHGSVSPNKLKLILALSHNLFLANRRENV